jgi:transcriptional regulator with XRE-family HTH domain
LRHARELAGFSQQNLADESGVSQHTISEIELGRRKPQGRTLRKLAKALDIDVRELFEEPALSGKSEAPRGAGLADADPSGKLADAAVLEDIAELWAMQLARGFYDRRTLGRMRITGFGIAHNHDANLGEVRENLPPHFRAQLEAAEERFAEVAAQIMEASEALEQGDRGHPTPPDELAAKREAREAEREEVLRQLRGSRPAKHA